MTKNLVKKSIILGIALPATLFVNLLSVSASDNSHRPLQDNLLKNNLLQTGEVLISEASEPEEPEEPIESEETTSEKKKSGSTAVFQTLIRTVGDVIKTDIKTKRQRSQQNTNQVTDTNPIPESSQETKLPETQGSQYTEQETENENPPEVLGNNSGNNNTAVEKLAKWGWTKVPCKPQLVFIYGLGEDTICIEPNDKVSAGQYQYDTSTHQLKPIKSSDTETPDDTPPTVVESN